MVLYVSNEYEILTIIMFCVAQFAYCQDSSIITYSEASAGVNFISDDDVKERVINRFL